MTRLTEHSMEIRVRYSETDAMAFLHHATFFVYFEMGRTELFRAAGKLPPGWKNGGCSSS